MGNITNKKLEAWSEPLLADFHAKRLEGIETVRISTILRRKNPYLFKAKNLEVVSDFVKGITDAYLSSQEEALFGQVMEGPERV